jgi:N-acetyl-anhydromuramyl-L-alanine amidase AmpD
MDPATPSAARRYRPLRAALAAWLALAGAAEGAKAPAKPASRPKPAPIVRSAGSVPVSMKYRSPRSVQRKVRKSTLYIVLHTTEGAAKGSLEKLSANGECHYVVDTDGTVYAIVDKTRIAFHAGLSMWDGRTELDGCSIGIEIVGRHDKEISAAQYASLKKLLGELKQTYTIPDSRVLTHSMVAYGNPNRWHKYKHRGRKRCGMLLATPSARAKLGLAPGPSFDPDVKAGRLRNADPDLAAVLYRKAPAVIAQPAKPAAPSKPGAQAKPGSAPNPPAAASVVPAPPSPPPAPESNVIGPRRSAWDIARDRYDDATTIYTFPNGRRKTGAEIEAKEWKAMPAGTIVEVGAGGESPENGNEGLLTIGVDGTAAGLAGDAVASPSTFYFPEKRGYRAGATMTLAEIDALPSGTRMLVGYRVVGPVSAKRPAGKLGGVAWDRGDTYYWDPARRTLKPGDEITAKTIPKDAMIFLRKD